MKMKLAALSALVFSGLAQASPLADSATAHLSTVSADSTSVGGILIGIGAVILGIIVIIRLLRRGTP